MAASKNSKSLPAKDVDAIFGAFAAANPTPKGELDYINPFTLLVAVVLSAQATDAGVNKATPKLFAAADTPEKMVALGQQGIEDLVKTIGLYRTKAKNVFALSQKLIAEFGSIVPENREALESLPGVGRKTANVVLNIAFRHPTIAVDTHLFRVANRTGLAPGATPLSARLRLRSRASVGESSMTWGMLAPCRATCGAMTRGISGGVDSALAGPDGETTARRRWGDSTVDESRSSGAVSGASASGFVDPGAVTRGDRPGGGPSRSLRTSSVAPSRPRRAPCAAPCRRARPGPCP